MRSGFNEEVTNILRRLAMINGIGHVPLVDEGADLHRHLVSLGYHLERDFNKGTFDFMFLPTSMNSVRMIKYYLTNLDSCGIIILNDEYGILTIRGKEL